MNKSIPLNIDTQRYQRIQVIGHSANAEALYHRVKAAVGNKAFVILSESPKSGYDLSLVVDRPFPPFDKQLIDAPAYVSEKDCYGLTDSHIFLNKTDWVALKMVERQLMAMHETGILLLPDKTLRLLKSRERSRDEVDREIRDALNERSHLPV